MKNDYLPLATIETLRQRAAIIARIRHFFDSRNYFEVETPVLSHDTVVDRYLHPIGISKQEVTGRRVHRDTQLWLQTSPEFGMKRIVAAGAEAIYQICKSFRQSELGHRHNPEFTMLEWYRVGDDMSTAMDFLTELIETILTTSGTKRITYRQAFEKFAHVDPFESNIDDLQGAARDQGCNVETGGPELSRDGWLNLILSELVEPQLGIEHPVIVYDWPATQSGLAIVRTDPDPVAERFELYVDGIELANGYHELLDPEELIKRNSINNQHRVKDGNRLLPEESRLLAAMHHGLPGCAGVAMGVDRLVMLALGVRTIGEVMAFPLGNA